MKENASVARGATSLYFANISVLAANTLYFLVLTNFLRSTVSVGIVTALNIMIWLLVTVCILAQPIAQQSPIPAPLAVLKFVPELLTKKSRPAAARLFLASLALSLGMGGVIMVILVVSPSVVIPLVGGQSVLPGYVRLSGVDVLLISLGQVCVGALIALRDMKGATSYLVLWSVVRYALASILLVYYAIWGVLVGWILGDAVLLVVALQRSLRALHGGVAVFPLSDLVRYSLYTLVSALIGFAVSQADKVFTLARQGLAELAIYNVAIVASSFAGFAPYALLTVLVPALSSLHAAGKMREMRGMVRAYTRYVAVIVIPVAFGFASVTAVALRIFGPVYVNGFAPSVTVSIATGITAVSAVYASTLVALGELKWFTAANAIGLVGLLVVAYLLTPILGLEGPALGRLALMVLATVVYAVALKKKGFFELDLKAYVCATGGATISGGLVYFALSFGHSFLTQLAMVPFLIVAGAIIYLFSLRVVHLLTLADVEFIGGMLPSRLAGLLPLAAKLAGLSWKTK